MEFFSASARESDASRPSTRSITPSLRSSTIRGARAGNGKAIRSTPCRISLDRVRVSQVSRPSLIAVSTARQVSGSVEDPLASHETNLTGFVNTLVAARATASSGTATCAIPRPTSPRPARSSATPRRIASAKGSPKRWAGIYAACRDRLEGHTHHGPSSGRIPAPTLQETNAIPPTNVVEQLLSD